MNHIHKKCGAASARLRDALELTAEEMAHQCDVSLPRCLLPMSGESDALPVFHRLALCLAVNHSSRRRAYDEFLFCHQKVGKGVKVGLRTAAYSHIIILPPDSSGESWRRVSL